MPSKNKEILNANAKKHYDKIKDDPEVRRKAKERAAAWYAANKQKAKETREKNKQAKAEYMKKWRSENKDKVKEHKAKSQKKNMAAALVRTKRYRETDKGRLVAQAVRDSYRKRVKEQSLNMYDKAAIIEIYKKCKEISMMTGESYEVDHIIPIKGELVSGLHVSWNLRVITAKENRTKSNKFSVDSTTIDS